MIRNHLLRLGHPVSVAALLEALVAVTNEPYDDARPRPIRLKYLAADGRKLPAWVNSGCGEAGLIVSDEPCPEFAAGTLLLWLRFVPVPRRGRVDDAGLYHGQVDVHLWQAPEYPLPRREVDWFVAHHCGARNNTWWHLTRGWQTLCDDTWRVPLDPAELPRPYIVLRRTPAPEPQADPSTAPPADLGGASTPAPQPSAAPDLKPRKLRQGSHRGAGQPRKPHSIWLLEKMRLLDDCTDYWPLFSGWLHVYEETEGYLPANPRAL